MKRSWNGADPIQAFGVIYGGIAGGGVFQVDSVDIFFEQYQ
jgi:hypothetical protein